ADFPGDTRVFDGRQRRRARAAVVPGDQNHVRVGLGHAGRDCPDTRLRHQLDADARARVHHLQVEDQLRQVFDRIDVVVWGRGDQRHARRRVAGLGDDRIDLVTRELAAFTGLCALRDLDLQFVTVDQV